MRGTNGAAGAVLHACLGGTDFSRLDGPVGRPTADLGAAERNSAKLSVRLPDVLFRRAYRRIGGNELSAAECRERFGALQTGTIGHWRIKGHSAIRSSRSIRACGSDAVAFASSYFLGF